MFRWLLGGNRDYRFTHTVGQMRWVAYAPFLRFYPCLRTLLPVFRSKEPMLKASALLFLARRDSNPERVCEEGKAPGARFPKQSGAARHRSKARVGKPGCRNGIPFGRASREPQHAGRVLGFSLSILLVCDSSHFGVLQNPADIPILPSPASNTNPKQVIASH